MTNGSYKKRRSKAIAAAALAEAAKAEAAKAEAAKADAAKADAAKNSSNTSVPSQGVKTREITAGPSHSRFEPTLKAASHATASARVAIPTATPTNAASSSTAAKWKNGKILSTSENNGNYTGYGGGTGATYPFDSGYSGPNETTGYFEGGNFGAYVDPGYQESGLARYNYPPPTNAWGWGQWGWGAGSGAGGGYVGGNAYQSAPWSGWSEGAGAGAAGYEYGYQGNGFGGVSQDVHLSRGYGLQADPNSYNTGQYEQGDHNSYNTSQYEQGDHNSYDMSQYEASTVMFFPNVEHQHDADRSNADADNDAKAKKVSESEYKRRIIQSNIGNAKENTAFENTQKDMNDPFYAPFRTAETKVVNRRDSLPEHHPEATPEMENPSTHTACEPAKLVPEDIFPSYSPHAKKSNKAGNSKQYNSAQTMSNQQFNRLQQFGRHNMVNKSPYFPKSLNQLVTHQKEFAAAEKNDAIEKLKNTIERKEAESNGTQAKVAPAFGGKTFAEPERSAVLGLESIWSKGAEVKGAKKQVDWPELNERKQYGDIMREESGTRRLPPPRYTNVINRSHVLRLMSHGVDESVAVELLRRTMNEKGTIPWEHRQIVEGYELDEVETARPDERKGMAAMNFEGHSMHEDDRFKHHRAGERDMFDDSLSQGQILPEQKQEVAEEVASKAEGDDTINFDEETLAGIGAWGELLDAINGTPE